MREAPPAVLMAIRVLLNHVEPGWENSVTFVQAWLDGKLEEIFDQDDSPFPDRREGQP